MAILLHGMNLIMTTETTNKIRSSIAGLFSKDSSDLRNIDVREENGIVNAKLYFKLLKQSILYNKSALTTLINVVKKLKGELRMYPEDNSICVEINFKKQQT